MRLGLDDGHEISERSRYRLSLDLLAEKRLRTSENWTVLTANGLGRGTMMMAQAGM